jgi:U6 snRNA-associated Sm-like protein LSm1
MAYNPNSDPPHGGPAGAPPNMNISFNQMLQRSMQEQGQHEPIAEAPNNPSQSIGMACFLVAVAC